MSDISKCSSDTCPLREFCYRWTAVPDPFWQAYTDFQYTILEDGKVDCDGYWGSSLIRNKLKVKKDGKL